MMLPIPADTERTSAQKWYNQAVMRSFVLHHLTLMSFAGAVILGALYMAWQVLHADPLAGLVTATVTRGTVEQIISVSGLTSAANAADLAFPTTGIVSKVYVKEGDTVAQGAILATLGADSLVAERNSAVADMRVAEANLSELLAGDTAPERAVQDTTVAIATAEVERTASTQKQLVENAKRTLRSSALVAKAVDIDEVATPPTISGTYTCTAEGTYTLSFYNSSAPSGYSFRTAGLEESTGGLSFDQPLPIGRCGLLIQLAAGERYGNSNWTITIPNPDAATYTVYKNALAAAETTAAAANAAAVEALTLARQKQSVTTSAPRSEAVDRARAAVAKSSAQIARIDAALGDRVIRAPFAGTVTDVNILPGEAAGVAPVFTVLATDNLELTARVPEIDITQVALDQPVRVLFDADRSNTHTGHVTYVSPLPIQIDGVAYFEVKITLEQLPAWLRGGLNADIDIITDAKENVLRVPKRYVSGEGTTTAIRTLSGTTIATTSITNVFDGNDGFVAIEGIPEGTTVVTP